MKWILLMVFSLSLGLSQGTFAAEEKGGLTWYTDLAEAHGISNLEKKPIFGFFTGSDWCGWCKLLQRNVFAKQAFIDWAKENVVLLEIDFPKRVQQSAELKTQNQNLQRALGVRGYPTVWFFNSSVNKETGGFHLTRLGKLGYPSGAEKGKEEVKFLEEANKILASTKQP